MEEGRREGGRRGLIGGVLAGRRRGDLDSIPEGEGVRCRKEGGRKEEEEGGRRVGDFICGGAGMRWCWDGNGKAGGVGMVMERRAVLEM
jgi:hypothetical protein